MNEPKFKVGDKVVVVSIRSEYNSPMTKYKGQVFTVRTVTYDQVYTKEVTESNFFSDELILERVYNSPLLKALR